MVSSFFDASLNVSSCFILADLYPSQIVDSSETEHITRGWGAYIEFRMILQGNRRIYVGNNSRIEIKGKDNCKLVF